MRLGMKVDLQRSIGSFCLLAFTLTFSPRAYSQSDEHPKDTRYERAGERQALSGMENMLTLFESGLNLVPAGVEKDVAMACVSQRFVEWAKDYRKILDAIKQRWSHNADSTYQRFSQRIQYVELAQKTFEQMRPGLFSTITDYVNKARNNKKWPIKETKLTVADPKLKSLEQNMVSCSGEDFLKSVHESAPLQFAPDQLVSAIDFDSMTAAMRRSGRGEYQGAGEIKNLENLNYEEFLLYFSSVR